MLSIVELDFGTPASKAPQQVTLTIDGCEVTVPAGTSVLRAASEAGIRIPKLCATELLVAFGSCRLCLVEIEGHRGYPASCTTPVEAGMNVATRSVGLQKIRYGVMELYLSDYPPDDGALPTEMREMVDAIGVTEVRYGFDGANHWHPTSKQIAGSASKPSPSREGSGPLQSRKDESNPYFTFDPAACIVCSRCVRACDEQQGTLALAVEGRGFASRIVAGRDEGFMQSECVSCGACVQACPTTALTEKSLLANGPAQTSVVTTCAYCGVGCSFRAEMRGEEAGFAQASVASEGRSRDAGAEEAECTDGYTRIPSAAGARDAKRSSLHGQILVRMVPNKDGHANHGHSCVKGRFATGYATHRDRILKPMVRAMISDPWREVSWQEAIGYAAGEFKRIQAEYGRDSIGGITSSRCTNEETYLVQKLVRAGFGNNNVDTCARVCHSPTGYGLKATLGESAGTQDFDSVMQADVIFVVGANPTDGHPVFASQMKQRLRQGAKLIVADPRRIDIVRTPHVRADFHLKLKPGTNVALLTSLAHVIVTEGLVDESFVGERCEADSFAKWRAFAAEERHSPEATEETTGVPAASVRAAARLYATAGNAAIYYGLGVTEHSQGSTAVMGIANLAMATGNIGREGVGVNPLRGQNNVQGSCDMGSFPHEFPGYRHVGDDAVRATFERAWGVRLQNEPGLRIPNMFEAALDGEFKGLYIEGEDIAQSDPNTQHVTASLTAMECVVVQDLFLNETAKFAHVFLPGSSFLEKDGTFTNAERRISRVRCVMSPRNSDGVRGYADWEITQLLSNAMGYAMNYAHPSEIMDEIARLTPTFRGVSFERIDELGSIQWPCNEAAPEGMPTMHVHEFVRGKGRFMLTEYVPTTEKVSAKYPLILTTGRILSQYNVGAQTRRTENSRWHGEDRLEIHPQDAEDRGIADGDWVGIESRAGQTVLRATVSSRMQPGVVYTTFHFPFSGANVITTGNSDWATNCPEYKVTAVQIMRVTQPSDWQRRYRAFSEKQQALLSEAVAK